MLSAVANAEGYMDVYSENSYGVCVPTNSSANEVIIGMARAAALSSSGQVPALLENARTLLQCLWTVGLATAAATLISLADRGPLLHTLHVTL